MNHTACSNCRRRFALPVTPGLADRRPCPDCGHVNHIEMVIGLNE